MTRLHFRMVRCTGALRPVFSALRSNPHRRERTNAPPLRNRKGRRGSCARQLLRNTALLHANDWPLWTTVVGCAALGQITSRSRIGTILSSPLLIMVFGFMASFCGIRPLKCAAYDVIWKWCVPLAVALYLLETDLMTSLAASAWIVPVFGVGAMGTVLGTFIAWWTVGKHLGADGWKVAAALCATYIGGSANLASTATALHLTSGPLLAAAVAADNVAMMLYLAAISVIPVGVPGGNQMPDASRASSPSSVMEMAGLDAGNQRSKEIRPREVPLTGLFFGLLSCCTGTQLASLLRRQNLAMAFAALMASSLGTFLNRISASSHVKGSRAAGSALMSVFFVAIGASCGSIRSVLTSTPWLFAFVLIQISVHLVFILFCCRCMDVPLMHILTASNANVGGPGTAAGMAAARGWDTVVQPAIVLGCLGYTVANLIGILISYSLRST